MYMCVYIYICYAIYIYILLYTVYYSRLLLCTVLSYSIPYYTAYYLFGTDPGVGEPRCTSRWSSSLERRG